MTINFNDLQRLITLPVFHTIKSIQMSNIINICGHTITTTIKAACPSIAIVHVCSHSSSYICYLNLGQSIFQDTIIIN